MIQYSPFHHQYSCGVKPLFGHTVIRRMKPLKKVGSIHLAERWAGRWQEDWIGEVVAVAEAGGWRKGDLHPGFRRSHAHLADRDPAQMTKKERTDTSLWQTPPYYVPKPELKPGDRVICCYFPGRPFLSANGYEYFLTDGEHTYKAALKPTQNQEPCQS